MQDVSNLINASHKRSNFKPKWIFDSVFVHQMISWTLIKWCGFKGSIANPGSLATWPTYGFIQVRLTYTGDFNSMQIFAKFRGRQTTAFSMMLKEYTPDAVWCPSFLKSNSSNHNLLLHHQFRICTSYVDFQVCTILLTITVMEQTNTEQLMITTNTMLTRQAILHMATTTPVIMGNTATRTKARRRVRYDTEVTKSREVMEVYIWSNL